MRRLSPTALISKASTVLNPLACSIAMYHCLYLTYLLFSSQLECKLEDRNRTISSPHTQHLARSFQLVDVNLEINQLVSCLSVISSLILLGLPVPRPAPSHLFAFICSAGQNNYSSFTFLSHEHAHGPCVSAPMPPSHFPTFSELYLSS